ncbi:hypothetical protein AWM69_10870 [Pseudomonas sp. D1HM]|nr:hypothetical protein [Pseudomonas sp. D1HM]
MGDSVSVLGFGAVKGSPAVGEPVSGGHDDCGASMPQCAFKRICLALDAGQARHALSETAMYSRRTAHRNVDAV